MFWKSKKNKACHQTVSTPAEDIQIANQALKEGDAQHAVQHLAWVFSTEPENVVARAMLDRILSDSPTPLDLTQWEKPPIPYPIAAIRAYIYVRQGNLDEAFSIMSQINQVVPGLPFLPWVVEWMGNSTQLGMVKPNTMLAFLTNLNPKITKELSEADFKLLEKLLPALKDYHETQSQNTNLTLFLSILYRKLEKFDEAISLVQTAHIAEPGYFTATVLGNAYRKKGMIDLAVAAFREALSFKPEDLPIRLDIGDTLCENGQIEEGLVAYQEVLSREPNHEWAYPSSLYYLSVIEPGEDWKKQLESFAKTHPSNQRAASLMRPQNPYLTELPEPSDATINIARQIMAKGTFPVSLSLSVSSLEAPSAYRVLQLIQIEQYGKPDVKLETGKIQRPDPRLPRGEVDFVLWRYNGTVPEPKLPAPSQEIAAVVAELATTPYDANNWWTKAEKYANQIGPTHLNDLLGVMLYPPTRIEQIPMWVWLQKVQLAATFIIARLDNGWENSLRKRTLFSLARGPMDWTVEAAIIVLCQIVRKEGIGKRDVEALYTELLRNMPTPGGVPYQYALVCCSFYIQPSPELAALAKKVLG